MNFCSFLQRATIPNYCTAYYCSKVTWAWTPFFEVCICPNINDLEEIDKTVNQNLQRCCPGMKLTKYDTQNGITCPNPKYPDFNSDWVKVHKKSTEFTVEDNEIKIVPKYGAPVTIEIKDKSQYCVGPAWLQDGRGDLEVPIKMHVFQFKEPCDGKKPCIR